LSENVGAPVTSAESRTSLQLSLENGKVAESADEYVRKLTSAIAGKSDVIGYAFAINGQLNGADVYVSNSLFKKLWPRMLKAAAVEAVAHTRGVRVAEEPTAGDVKGFLSDSDKAKPKERPVTGSTTVVTREEKDNVLFEARDERTKTIVHRSYIKKQ
jgi:hypothetical protein